MCNALVMLIIIRKFLSLVLGNIEDRTFSFPDPDLVVDVFGRSRHSSSPGGETVVCSVFNSVGLPNIILMRTQLHATSGELATNTKSDNGAYNGTLYVDIDRQLHDELTCQVTDGTGTYSKSTFLSKTGKTMSCSNVHVYFAQRTCSSAHISNQVL